MKGTDGEDLPEPLGEFLELNALVEQDARAIAAGKITDPGEFERTARRLAASQLALIDDMPKKMKPWMRSMGFPLDPPERKRG